MQTKQVRQSQAQDCIWSNCPIVQEFSEWAQCQVLEFATHYRPSDEQEVYDFMNVLDDRLSHSNSAVVMATVKMFLHYTLTMPATHQQVKWTPFLYKCFLSLSASIIVTHAN